MPIAAGSTVFVVKVIAATTVTRPRSSASANSAVPRMPSTTMAHSDGCTTMRQAGSGMSSPRADTATQVKANPAANASKGADQEFSIRRPSAPRPASGSAIASSSQCQIGANVGTSPETADNDNRISPMTDEQSAIPPGRPNGLPDATTTIAVTATLDATTAWTRNNGSSCNATMVNANPRRSTARPAK